MSLVLSALLTLVRVFVMVAVPALDVNVAVLPAFAPKTPCAEGRVEKNEEQDQSATESFFQLDLSAQALEQPSCLHSEPVARACAFANCLPIPANYQCSPAVPETVGGIALPHSQLCFASSRLESC